MKNYLKQYAALYGFFSLFSLVIAVIVQLTTDEDLSHIKVAVGNIFIALLFNISLAIFKAQKYRAINTALGFLVLLPVVGILRGIYELTIFKGTVALYCLFLILLAVYFVVVYNVHKKGIKDKDILNALLYKKKKIDDKIVENKGE